MTTTDPTYDPPQPNAALVVGPDDVLVLSLPSSVTRLEYDEFRDGLTEKFGDRFVVVVGAEDVAVLRGAP